MTEDIPEMSNVFGSLKTSLSRGEVAESFRKFGWQVRRCSFADYEVALPGATLVIESQSPILFHGPVANALIHMPDILAPLQIPEIEFEVECYDADGTLLHLWKS